MAVRCYLAPYATFRIIVCLTSHVYNCAIVGGIRSVSAADEIKGRLDIVQYINQYVPLKKQGKYWKAPCPFHGEKTPSFVVNEDNQSWRCFGACATGGDIFNFAMKQNGWTFREALDELGKLAGVEVRRQTPEQRQRGERLDTLRGIMKNAADFYHERLGEPDDTTRGVLNYAVNKRGLTLETLRLFQIGYAPDEWRFMTDALTALGYSEDELIEVGLANRSDNGRVYDRFRNRLLIPIRDDRGRVVGFGGRALSADEQAKYINSPQSPLFDKSGLLFALDLAKPAIRATETVVIVEGYLDAIQAHQAGYTNVVAQMGTALTDTQIKALAKLAKRVVMSLDSDAAGQSATRRSLEVARTALQADYAARMAIDIRILTVPDAKDPDDLIREHPETWASLVENATPVPDYVIDAELAALPANATLPEREAAARRLLPMLTASESELYRKDNLQKLALRLRIAERDLLNWAADQQRHDAAKPKPATQTTTAPDAPADDEPYFPPLDFDAAPPDDDAEWSDAPELAAIPKRDLHEAQVTAREAAAEAHCLGALFHQPELIYPINRKLRELANNDAGLRRVALMDFTADDFTRTGYRQLMAAFLEGIGQDERDPLDHVRAAAQHNLDGELAFVLADHWDTLRPRLFNGLAADLAVCLRQSRRFANEEPHTELVTQALRLRRARLGRDLHELSFLQADAADDDDLPYATRAQLVILAQRLIDQALHQRTHPQRL